MNEFFSNTLTVTCLLGHFLTLFHYCLLSICTVRLVDSVLTDVHPDRVSVVVKTDDMIIQSRLRWYGHVMRGDINSQIREVMEVEITAKRKKGRPRKSWVECIKDLERYGFRREDMYDRKKWRERIGATINNPRPSGIMALKRTLLSLSISL